MTLIILIILLAVGVWAFMQQDQFGKLPTGKRLERIQKSPNYKDGQFKNLNPTPQLSENSSLPKALWKFVFDKVENGTPKKPFHFVKTEINKIPSNEDVFIWFGHSSYYIQTDGKKILVDPVFSGAASPVKSTTRAYAGSDLYTTDDFPEIDYLVITHDHWDHLDYETVKKLQPKVKIVVTGLGTGAHLEYWGLPESKIVELDWFEKKDFNNQFVFNAEPARHFSGRGFKRDQSLWMSFVVQTPTKTIYIGGDSGYDTHFKKIGDKYKGIDYAILENGQYNEDWRYIHMLPGEQDIAMLDLQAKNLIPVHNSKFKLSKHSWKEPMEKVVENKKGNYGLLMPQIGEKLSLSTDTKTSNLWWKTLE